MRDPVDLDGGVLDIVSSTAGRVDPEAPTRFRWRETAGVVWGDHVGDTVSEGRFVEEFALDGAPQVSARRGRLGGLTAISRRVHRRPRRTRRPGGDLLGGLVQ